MSSPSDADVEDEVVPVVWWFGDGKRVKRLGERGRASVDARYARQHGGVRDGYLKCGDVDLYRARRGRFVVIYGHMIHIVQWDWLHCNWGALRAMGRECLWILHKDRICGWFNSKDGVMERLDREPRWVHCIAPERLSESQSRRHLGAIIGTYAETGHKNAYGVRAWGSDSLFLDLDGGHVEGNDLDGASDERVIPICQLQGQESASDGGTETRSQAYEFLSIESVRWARVWIVSERGEMDVVLKSDEAATLGLLAGV